MASVPRGSVAWVMPRRQPSFPEPLVPFRMEGPWQAPNAASPKMAPGTHPHYRTGKGGPPPAPPPPPPGGDAVPALGPPVPPPAPWDQWWSWRDGVPPPQAEEPTDAPAYVPPKHELTTFGWLLHLRDPKAD